MTAYPRGGTQPEDLRMQWFTSLDGWVQALLASLMMYLMTALGASFVFFSKKINKTFLTALTGLAAGIVVAASFFSLGRGDLWVSKPTEEQAKRGGRMPDGS